MSPSADRLVIDMGCGTGANAAAFARAYRSVGIDVSQKAIETARRRFPGVEFICGAAPDTLGELAARSATTGGSQDEVLRSQGWSAAKFLGLVVYHQEACGR